MKNIIFLLFLISVNTLIAQKFDFEKEKFNNHIALEEYREALSHIYRKSELLDKYENDMDKYDFAKLKGGILSLRYNIINAIKGKNEVEGIKWITYQEALVKQKKEPKKIIIRYIDEFAKKHLADKVLKTIQENNYRNPELVKYVNTNFYAVKVETKKEMYDFDIKFPENIIEIKREREAEQRERDIKRETKKERKERKEKEKTEGVKIAQNYYVKDFFRDFRGPLSRLFFISKTGEYIFNKDDYATLPELEYYMKLIGSNKYNELETEEEFQEYYENLEKKFVVNEPINANREYFNGFKDKKDYISFINDFPKKRVSEIDIVNKEIGLKSIQSGCEGTFNKFTKTLENKNHCSSKLWLKEFPFEYENNSVRAYEFELNFSLTPEFGDVKSGFPLQIMLGNSPDGYTWLGVDKKGMFYLSYKDDKGYTDILEVFNADRIYLDKPNHIRFVWFPDGNYYVEVNSYKDWSFDLKTKKIPLYGLSNRIVFYSDVKINSMFLSTF